MHANMASVSTHMPSRDLAVVLDSSPKFWVTARFYVGKQRPRSLRRRQAAVVMGYCHAALMEEFPAWSKLQYDPDATATGRNRCRRVSLSTATTR